jgi:FkbM family methyltransferase
LEKEQVLMPPQYRHFRQLLADEIAYHLIRILRRRACKSGDFHGTIVVPIDDIIGQRVISTGRYEFTQFDAIRQFIESPYETLGLSHRIEGTMIDVGANIGLYTMAFSSAFTRILALEANPITYKILETNLTLTKVKNAVAVCIGASSKAGIANIYVPHDNLGWARIGTGFEDERISQAIQLDTLDNIIVAQGFDKGPIGLVKIDVEGHEASVLRGARQTLTEKGPVVLYEALDDHAARECATILRESGYTSFYRFRRQMRFFNLMGRSGIDFIKIDPITPGASALICATRPSALSKGFQPSGAPNPA